jgi:hypothetical protein
MQLKPLLLVLLIGCASQEDSGGSGSGSGSLPTFEQACAPVACATGSVATEASHVEAVIDGTTTWTPFGPYTTGCLEASMDVPVHGSFTVRGADLAVPSDCGIGCGQDVRFRLRDQPAGVECIGPISYFDFTLCEEVKLTDTTVRLRMLIEDVHPAEENYIPIVEVLPACVSACGTDQLACEATNTCWNNARDYCAYCLGGSNEVCGCWDGETFAADGETCSIAQTGDTYVGGTCQTGTCVLE